VHAGYNNDGTWVDAVEHGVRKALEQETTQVTKDDCLAQRMARDFAERSVDHIEELFAKTRPLSLVPRESFFDICSRCRPNNQVHY
jgi:hypothetical protein